MSGLQEWPALTGGWTWPASLRAERAVWGKVHGEPTDFRWIAASRDPEEAAPGLSRQLNLGTEDQPVRAFLWRNLGEICCAVAVYPSQAVDADGRQNFLEKQALLWRRPAELPACLGALALLPQAEGRGHGVWWDRQRGRPWSDQHFMLPIADGEHAPVPVREADLAAVVERGVTLLRQAIAEQDLAALYARMLSGSWPACLSGLDRPLPPEAVAALLLPLPRRLADALSLAGWLPSSRFSLDDLAVHWPAICLPPGVAPPPALAARVAPEAAGETGLLERSAALARALVRLDPGAAATSLAPMAQVAGTGAGQLELPGRWTDAPPLAASPELAAEREAAPDGVAAPEAGNPSAPAAATAPSGGLVAAGSGHGGTSGGGRPRLAERPHLRFGLAPPPPGATRLLQELHVFACAPQRRWLDAVQLSRRVERLAKPDPAAARLIAGWIAVLAAGRPAVADEEQWTVKLDLLRCAALALAPLPDTWELIGLPAGGRVATLHFADLHASPLDRLADLGQEALAAALEQSLSCVPNAAARRVRAMIVGWRGRTSRRNPPVRHLIDEALARHPAPDGVL
jgi:hypothetical protein